MATSTDAVILFFLMPHALQYNAIRYLLCVVLGLLLGAMYWDMGKAR